MRSSYSRLGAYSFCAKKYEYRYVAGIPVPAKAELAFGVSLHAALEENFRQKLETRKDLPVETVAAYFRGRLDQALSPVPEESLRGPADPHYLRAMGEHFLTRFLEERAPTIQPAPKGVECRFQLPLPSGHVITGAFDLLDSAFILHDFKTSSKPYTRAKADRTQLVIYAWACEQIFGRPPSKLCFDVFVKGDGAEGAVELQPPLYFDTPSPAEMSQVASRLAAQLDQLTAIEARGQFHRAFSPLRCHWCEYQSLCQADWEKEGRPDPRRIPLTSLVD